MKRARERLAQDSSRGLRCRSAGFSLVEVLVVIVILLIIAAIAIPRLLNSKMAANEAAAVAALRSIATVEVSYETTYNLGFAPNLSALGPPLAGAQPSALKADLVDEVLATGIRNGYNFDYKPIDNAGTGKPDAFTVNANPVRPGQTGQKYFYLDQTHVIRWALNGPANANSRPIPQ